MVRSHNPQPTSIFQHEKHLYSQNPKHYQAHEQTTFFSVMAAVWGIQKGFEYLAMYVVVPDISTFLLFLFNNDTFYQPYVHVLGQ